MLVEAFYNLSESKKPPVISIKREYGGVCISFSDEGNDSDLQVVLSPTSFSALLEKSSEFLAGTYAPGSVKPA
jgi:hypothetical protein